MSSFFGDDVSHSYLEVISAIASAKSMVLGQFEFDDFCKIIHDRKSSYLYVDVDSLR